MSVITTFCGQSTSKLVSHAVSAFRMDQDEGGLNEPQLESISLILSICKGPLSSTSGGCGSATLVINPTDLKKIRTRLAVHQLCNCSCFI